MSRQTKAILAFGSVLCVAIQTGFMAPAQAESRRFNDWEWTCPNVPSVSSTPSTTERCRISHKLAIQDSGQTVFALTILPGDKRNDFVGVVSIPLGGYIAPGIEMRIDGKKAYKLLIETCNANGCHAGFPIPPALMKELQRSKTAVFRLWTTKAKPADITVSLNGFVDAAKALQDSAK